MPNCYKGKPCGCSCIRKDFTCNKGSCLNSKPNCCKGKSCGNACIPLAHTCRVEEYEEEYWDETIKEWVNLNKM